MNLPAFLMTFYGLLLLVGGLIGHLKAGSHASLISGILTGILAVICGIGLWQGKARYLLAACILVGLLSLFFLYRFSLAYQFMPAGMMFAISAILFLFLLFSLIKR